MRWLRKKPTPVVQFVRRFAVPAPLQDPGNDPRYQSSRVLRLVRHLPVVLISVPERVVLNYSFILVGLSAFIADEPGSILAGWPQWVLYAWGLSMAVGGASVLVGMFRNLTSVERLGYLLVAPACMAYAVSAVWTRGLTGVPVFLMFFGLSMAKVIRMIISSAERDMTIEYGQRLDREAKRRTDES